MKVQLDLLADLPMKVRMDIENKAIGELNGSGSNMTTFLNIARNVGYKVIMKMSVGGYI